MKKLITLLILTVIAGSAFCKTITVTSSADSGAGTLRQAVIDADIGDVIVFADNVTTIYFAAAINLDKNITINRNETNNTIFQDAAVWTDNTNKKRFFEILENAELTLNHLTLKDHIGNCSGGAILNRGNLILNNCTFSNNRAYDTAGAILSQGPLVAKNCIFNNNVGPKAGGGAINCNDVYLESCIFKDNTSGGNSGALYIGNSAYLQTATIKDCYFEGNRGVFAGVITNYAKMSIDNCTFKKNKSTDNETVIHNAAEILINNTVFEENQGAVFENSHFRSMVDVTATIINCRFTKNYFATNTSLVSQRLIQNAQNASLYIINSTIADNTAVGLGSNNYEGYGTKNFTNTYLYNNIFYNNIPKNEFDASDILVSYNTDDPSEGTFTLTYNNIIDLALICPLVDIKGIKKASKLLIWKLLAFSCH
jgi:predicted outer membrane repeat protein